MIEYVRGEPYPLQQQRGLRQRNSPQAACRLVSAHPATSHGGNIRAPATSSPELHLSNFLKDTPAEVWHPAHRGRFHVLYTGRDGETMQGCSEQWAVPPGRDVTTKASIYHLCRPLLANMEKVYIGRRLQRVMGMKESS